MIAEIVRSLGVSAVFSATCLLSIVLLFGVGCGGPENQSAKVPYPASEAVATDGGTDSSNVGSVDGAAADEVLSKMVAAYRGAKTYFDNALYHERFVQRAEGVPRQPPPHQVSVVFSRPIRFRITRREPNSEGDDFETVIISDGNRWVATVSDADRAIYNQEAPTKLTYQELMAADGLKERLLPVPIENLFPQLDLLIATDESPPRLLAGAAAKLLPAKKLNGDACHRIELRRDAGKYVAWIDKETSLLRRLEIPTEEVRRQLDPRGDLIRLDLWIDFDDANFDTPIGEQTFRIEMLADKPEAETNPQADEKTIHSITPKN